MPTEVTYGLPYDQWNWRIGVYIAMIGLAGGAYLTGYVADLLAEKRDSRQYGQVATFGYLVGLGGLAIGPPILLSHLAAPFRAMMIPLTMTNLGSWMSIGAYMLMGFGLGTTLMFLWLAFGTNRPHVQTLDSSNEVAADGGEDVAADGGPAKAATSDETAGGFRGAANKVGLMNLLDSIADYTRPSRRNRLVVGALFGIFAAGVLVYSAMAYGSGSTERVALWDPTFLLPVQILTGLGAGLTIAVGLAALAERDVGRPIQNCSLGAAGLLAGGLVAVLATLFLLPEQIPEAQPAVDNLTSAYALEFVGIALVGGLLLPIVLSIAGTLGVRRDALSDSGAVGAYVAAAALVVAGKLALALSYLMAAEFTPMPLPV
ncbi:dehydrogenase [Natronorubrum daqingense]|uniref:Dehydrogenase n=1 Tax=Natronorubrum daqingense TaxID=588898 RepID=A0A1N7CR51_9EURY|nr:dehydrogenase [Natronorubrum daqingense]APX97025.1 dehydrogenase [Natronorubrum daqingense]SIR66128.1 hypothetical protein SAMN05421809_1843 [Natronorubrum daqingense]